MKEERTEGIVLQAIPYQEHHHILTIFTLERGIIKLFARGRKQNPHALAQPLTRARFIYTVKGDKSLFQLREGSIIDQYTQLRTSYQRLQLGCSLAQAILKTQMLWKAAPELYQLFVAYLKEATKEGANVAALETSFLLKLLKHEGVLPQLEVPLIQLADSRSLKEINTIDISKTLKDSALELFNLNY